MIENIQYDGLRFWCRDVPMKKSVKGVPIQEQRKCLLKSIMRCQI